MLVHPHDPSLFLVEIEDIRQAEDTRQPVVREYFQTFSTMLDWAEAFLCHTHAELGREGAVCPYTKASLNRSHFRMTVCHELHASVSFVTQTILRYRDWFLEITPVLPAAEAFYKTILILFPRLAEDRVSIIIDEIQRTLKPLFVQAGLMIGQFHEKCNEPGLWNQDFRPLHSPLPLLAIRHMVPTDFPFLRHEPVFLEAYLKNYGQQIPQRWLSAVQLQRNLFGL